jgi:Asp-tRNA(Asn)/Glu-tRNA(Gln) amidotransferase A subunit family amidase
MAETLARRDLFKLALTTAGVGLGVALIDAQGTATAPPAPATPPQQPPAPPLPPLGNGEPPAMIFQAYPGGTGAYLEKIRKERGSAAFDRAKFTVEPWTGKVPATEEDIAFLPVHRLAALIQAKRITSVELTRIYLDRLKRFDPILLCAVTIMETQARQEAERADAEIRAGKYRGPLHGIPYGVKDLFSTKGVRTTWGSSDFDKRIIEEDAEIVVRLREAGAVLIAKLSTGRFASGDNWYRGRTKNPWQDPSHPSLGGSSGSSAGPSSATAAGCVAFGIGTETRGSIVSPATRCGLSALRPTFGRVTRHGGMVLAWSMDKVGPICRTVEDCALVFNTIHGVDEKDPSTVTAPFHFDRRISLAKLRIGYDENDARAKPFLDKLRELGASLKPMKPRPVSERIVGGGGGLGVERTAAFEVYSLNPLAFPDTARGGGGGRGGAAGAGRGDDPAAAARGGADAAAGARGGGDSAPGRGGDAGGGRGGGGRGGGTPATALAFLQSQRRRLILMQQMAEVMADYDMYVTSSGDVGLTNDTGHPAVVVQSGFGAPPVQGGGRGRGDAPPAPPPPPVREQPLVTTIVGGLFNDDKILSVAHAYQMATDWHTRHPKL